MGYTFTKDAGGGTKITYTNGIMYWNGPVFIQPSFNYDITISCGDNALNLHLSDIDSIAGQPPAATVSAVIEQLIAVFPDALAEALAGAVKKVAGIDPGVDGNVPLTAANVGAVPTVNTGSMVYGTNQSGEQTPVAYSTDPGAFKLVMRDFNGNFTVNAPTADQQPASKKYVDDSIAAISVSGSSPALTYPDVPAGGFLDLGFNIAGAAIGDAVSLGIPAAAQIDGVLFSPMVSNTGVITIRCYNFTGSPVTVPAGVYKATVFKK